MTNFKTGPKGIRLITHCESIHDGDLTMVGLQPKLDPVGIWTEGYGRAMRYQGDFLRGEENKALAYQFQTIHTVEEAMTALLEDLSYFEAKLNKLGICSTQEEFDSLISFSYNLGFGNLLESTLLKWIRADKSHSEIKAAFMMWNKGKVGGIKRVLPGLTLRRGYEADLYNTGEFTLAA